MWLWYIDEINHTTIICPHKVQTRQRNIRSHFPGSINTYLLFWQLTLERKMKSYQIQYMKDEQYGQIGERNP